MIAEGLRAVAVALVLATLLPLTPARAWWVRAWDFPRVQLAVLLVLTVLALPLAARPLASLDVALLVAIVACLALQLTAILPFSRLWPKEVVAFDGYDGQSKGGLGLVVVNVLMTNRRSDGLFEHILEVDPDLVLALETDRWWTDRLGEHLSAYPHRVEHPLDNTYGIALYSRLELVGTEIRFLLSDEIPSIRTRVRLRSGQEIRFFGIHPEPPAPGEADTSLPRDAELLVVAREVEVERLPTLVAGDLNDVAWSHTSRLFRRISGLLDPRVGRGLFSTFHADWWPLRWPLDHVFHGPAFTLKDLRRLPRFGSDHFPIFIALELTPSAERDQPPVEAEASDRIEAAETLQEARQG